MSVRNDHRTSVGELARLMAERRQVTASSVTLKCSAQGVLMPEVTIGEGLTDAQLRRMTAQAKRAYVELLKAAR